MFATEDATGSLAPADTAPPAEPITAAEIVRDRATLDRLVQALEAAPIIAFDTETTATDTLRAELVGLSFAVREGAGWYVPVGHTGVGAEGQLPLNAVLTALRPVLADPARPKVAHNAKYDLEILRRVGVPVAGLTFDTMIAEFLIDPGARLGLKALAKVRLGLDMTAIDAIIGKGKGQITMAEVPVAEAAAYAAADADVTLRLMTVQAPDLDRLGLRRLFDEIEIPLVPVLVDMELAGVKIDTAFLQAMSVRLGERLLDNWHNGQHMLARGHLGIDAAVARMQFHLRSDDGGHQGASVFEHSRGGFIAGGFDGEDTSRFEVSHRFSVISHQFWES